MANQDREEKTAKFLDMVAGSDNIVFFGGAGVSTESGIPDFRSVDGLYNQQYDYPPETILSHTFYRHNTEEFYRFYRKVKAVITQNIDGLHQLAGSRKVLELHGSVHRNYCESCHQFYDAEYILNSEGVPHCGKCGGDLKPDVVLYEEGLNNQTIQEAVLYISQADMLIIGGTSLAVYPAAGLVDYYQGKKLVLINKTPTPRDSMADLVLQESIGALFGKIKL